MNWRDLLRPRQRETPRALDPVLRTQQAAAAVDRHLDEISRAQAKAAAELELIRQQVELMRRAATGRSSNGPSE